MKTYKVEDLTLKGVYYNGIEWITEFTAKESLIAEFVDEEEDLTIYAFVTAMGSAGTDYRGYDEFDVYADGIEIEEGFDDEGHLVNVEGDADALYDEMCKEFWHGEGNAEDIIRNYYYKAK